MINIDLLYFTSPNCCVCDVLKPKIIELINTLFPEVGWREINNSTQPKLAAENQVFVSPVLIIKIEGKEYARFVRNFSLFQLKEKLERIYLLMK